MNFNFPGRPPKDPFLINHQLVVCKSLRINIRRSLTACKINPDSGAPKLNAPRFPTPPLATGPAATSPNATQPPNPLPPPVMLKITDTYRSHIKTLTAHYPKLRMRLTGDLLKLYPDDLISTII
ncbi:hypothetical protein TNCT_60411 [Trichonephila clavata]|uniref:Uncharacterized protein n=1 Tax=Trichonephila clavata TaxID=2740835 RepID=A0A8X6G967_TRICU|nr:hypothetical protein TNCT_60411 [Trichonephila clavata]